MKLKVVVEKIKQAEKNLPSDREIEIGNYDGEIWVSSYCDGYGSEQIEMLCLEEDIDVDELIVVCNKNGWYCVL